MMMTSCGKKAYIFEKCIQYVFDFRRMHTFLDQYILVQPGGKAGISTDQVRPLLAKRVPENTQELVNQSTCSLLRVRDDLNDFLFVWRAQKPTPEENQQPKEPIH